MFQALQLVLTLFLPDFKPSHSEIHTQTYNTSLIAQLVKNPPAMQETPV